ncbi:MAG: hypothetical protein ACREBU_04270 [Nitrososphaera sp.]
MTSSDAGAASQDPAEDLRGAIESAIAGNQEDAADVEQEPREAALRGRDGRGRFAPRTAGDGVSDAPREPGRETGSGEPGSQESLGGSRDAGAGSDKPLGHPPPGFSVASKAAWDNLPQYIRDDIAKREQEVDAGFKRYSGLGRIADVAERNGTSLQQAVHDYVGVENALRNDFTGGIEFICQRMGVHPLAVAQSIAAKYIGDGGQGGESQQSSIDHHAIAQHAAGVVRQELEHKESAAQVAAFASNPKNKYFDNLRLDMARLLNAGKADTLEQAYEAACWLNPDIRASLIDEARAAKSKEAASAVSRSRSAAKAVGGSPATGINPDAVSRRKNLTLEEEINAAIDAQAAGA